MDYVPLQPNMNRVRNILLEAIEVAFIICNSRNIEFDVHTIGIIMSSVIPTAFVLSTAFWVFFASNRRGGALCVCDRYRVGTCKHIIENNYWIMQEGSPGIKITSDNNIPIIQRVQIGHLYAVPINVLVDINQIDRFGALEIYIHFYVKLIPNEMDNNENSSGPHEFSVDNRKLTKHVIKTRLRLISEYEPGESMVIFNPHPACHSGFGHFVPEVLNKYMFLSPYGYIKLIPETHKLYDIEMPNFTLTMEFLSTWSIRPLWESNICNLFDRTKRRYRHGDRNRCGQSFINNNNSRIWETWNSNVVEHDHRSYSDDDEEQWWALHDLFQKCTTQSDNNNNINNIREHTPILQTLPVRILPDLVGRPLWKK